MTLVELIWKHKTKVMGFCQITIAQMVGWTFLPPIYASILGTINGLLTVWIGFANTTKEPQ